MVVSTRLKTWRRASARLPPVPPRKRLVHRLSQSRHSGNLILNTKQRVAPAHGESFVWIGALARPPPPVPPRRRFRRPPRVPRQRRGCSDTGFPMWHPSAKLSVARNRSKGKSDGFYHQDQARQHEIESEWDMAAFDILLIRDTPPVGMYVLNMFCMRGSRLWGSSHTPVLSSSRMRDDPVVMLGGASFSPNTQLTRETTTNRKKR